MSAPNKNFDPKEVAALQPENVAAAVDSALAAIADAATLDDLKAVKTAHAGDKSPLALANREIGALPPSAKADAGKRVGMARGQVKKALAQRTEELQALEDSRVLLQEKVDVTAVPHRMRPGGRHPVQSMQEMISDIFVSMGWRVCDGPEVEAEWFNFDALNFGPDHPARQMQDTFYMAPAENNLVLRTHTSPVQARTMLTEGAPLYMASVGRVYRTDEIDATHSPMFHQIEGLAIDRGLSMAHLKGTLDHLAQAVFGENVTTRLRPSFFPFTEPSAEMDLPTPAAMAEVTGAEGVSGSDTGWIEWGGCGMVNPNVLKACGIDPDVYSGFAFGMGVDRGLMLRTGVTELRELFEGDVRFNAQFGREI